MDVLVLAGGKISPELKAATSAESRAMIPINGKPMLEWVLDATTSVGPAVVVGGPQSEAYRSVESGATFLESIRNGLSEITSESFLLVTADLPFLTQAAVLDFLNRCDLEAMLNYPVIPVQLCEARFPGMKRTSIKTREGRFTGGNLALINRQQFEEVYQVMETAYSLRKSPLKLAKVVGIGTLLSVAVGQLVPTALSLKSLERAVGRFLGAKVKAIVTEFPEIGADIDNLEQYQAVQA